MHRPARQIVGARRSGGQARGRWGWLCLGAPVIGVGCVSLETRVPPVDGAVLASAQDMGLTPAQVERGREVYLGSCTRCHSAQGIGDFDVQEWESILRSMSKKAKLDAADGAAVRAYVLAARQATPVRPAGI